jgi:hypothetical protein
MSSTRRFPLLYGVVVLRTVGAVTGQCEWASDGGAGIMVNRGQESNCSTRSIRPRLGKRRSPVNSFAQYGAVETT